MQIRPMTPADLEMLDEIDATIDASQYVHIERVKPPGEGTAEGAVQGVSFSLQDRPLRERMTLPNRLTDELKFTAKQIATGGDDGLALVAEHEGQLVGMLLAQVDAEHGTYNLIDLRVDYDFRRQGLGLAMLFQVLSEARDKDEIRAVRAETAATNYPAIGLFRKTSFELTGLDTHRHSNHDLVKEQVTLLWYAALD